MHLLLLLLLLPLLLTTTTTASRSRPRPLPPITLSQTGGFPIAGRTIPSPYHPNQSLSCDHAYIEYFHPLTPRRTSLLLWHSSSTQVFQNTWSGGPGLKDHLLRRNYPVYLWDGPRVGRANWGCEGAVYTPAATDAANFVAWNFGPRYGVWWEGVRFPIQDEGAWKAATRARYVEYDSRGNVELQAGAAAVAADSGRVGREVVYVTSSAGGLRAQVAVAKGEGDNVRGIVAYESIGYVYPDNVNVTAGMGGFGPYVVPVEEFKKLARLRAVQFVWGDHRPENMSSVVESRRVAKLINDYGGNAEVLKLGEDAGLKGSTHLPFADLGNEDVVDLLEAFLKKNGLDGYADEEGDDDDDDE